MKKKILNIGVITLLMIMIFSLTGCEKKIDDVEENNDNEKFINLLSSYISEDEYLNNKTFPAEAQKSTSELYVTDTEGYISSILCDVNNDEKYEGLNFYYLYGMINANLLKMENDEIKKVDTETIDVMPHLDNFTMTLFTIKLNNNPYFFLEINGSSSAFADGRHFELISFNIDDGKINISEPIIFEASAFSEEEVREEYINKVKETGLSMENIEQTIFEQNSNAIKIFEITRNHLEDFDFEKADSIEKFQYGNTTFKDFLYGKYVVEFENLNEPKEDVEEESLYSVITTLDEKYEGAEIKELQEPISMYFTVYPKKYRDEISVIQFKEKYGLISNTTGKVVIEPVYDFLDNCLDDMESDYIYGYIGEQRYKIDFDNYTVTEVSISGHGGGSEFYYNPEKDEIYTQVYEYDPYIGSYDQSNTIQDFKELGTTLAPCSIDNEKYGFFDVTNGKIVIEPVYNSATLLADGYSAVSKDGKYFFINEKNEKVIDSEFEEAQNIHNEKAWVKINGKWTLVKFNKLKKDEVKDVSNTSDNDVQWKKIYKEYILNNNLQEFDIKYYEPSISFLDLNTDGVPELIYQDGMEGGPRANKPYLIFGIKNNNVEKIYDLWSGPYIKVGYNKENDDYAYEAVHKGVSYDTAIVEISTRDGFEEKSNLIESGDAYKLSEHGYKTNEFTMPETKFLNSFSQEEKEKAINEAFNNYKPTEELIN